MSTGCTARAAIDAKFREVELDLEYVVRCVDEIRHVGSPARAARKQTKNVIALLDVRPCLLLSGIMPSSWVISFIDVKGRLVRRKNM